MTYTLDDLRSSFALLDYRCDHGSSVPEIAAELGLNISDLMHVADQRGMRVALIATEDIEGLAEAQATGVFRLNPAQRQLAAMSAAVVMDAVAATLQMVKKADDDSPH